MTRHIPNVLVLLLMVAFMVTMGELSLNRHQTLGTAGNDLGNLDQAVWNTSQGRFFESTNWRGGTVRLGAHVEPILLPLALIYKVAPGPESLLVLQAFLVALGAMPIAWFARRRLSTSWASPVFAAAYLAFPALQAANLYEFHPLTLTAPFFSLAIVGLLERKNWMFITGALLAVACKEDMPLITAGMGLYAMVVQRRWKLGAITIALSTAWFFFATSYLVPRFNPGGSSPYLPRYRSLGSSIPEIALTLITRPWLALPLLTAGDPFAYLSALLVPVALLPLAAPAALIAIVPPVMTNLLSNNPGQRLVENNHYPAPLIGILVASAILGSARIRGWLLTAFKRLPNAPHFASALPLAVIVIATGGYTYARGFTPLARDFEMARVNDHHRAAERIFAMVPPDVSVNATPQPNPHLTDRRDVVVWPWGRDQDVFVWDSSPYAAQYVAQDMLNAINRLIGSGYGLTAADDGIYLLEKGKPSTATLKDAYLGDLIQSANPDVKVDMRFGNSYRLLGYSIRYDTSSSPYLEMVFEGGTQITGSEKLFLINPIEDGDPYYQLPGPTFLPVSEWQGKYLRVKTPAFGRWRRPGDKEIQIVATNGGTPADRASRLPVTDLKSNTLVTAQDDIVTLATLSSDGKTTIDATPVRPTDIPAGVGRLDATVGPSISLVGATVGNCAESNCSIPVTLYWKTNARITERYTVFVHIIDTNGKLIAQHGGPPANGIRPTTDWQSGEVVADLHVVSLNDVGPTPIQVIAGLYESSSGNRLGSATVVAKYVIENGK